MKMPIVDLARIIEVVEADAYIGFCTSCGSEQGRRCEPDARDYICEACNQHTVFGAEELLFMCEQWVYFAADATRHRWQFRRRAKNSTTSKGTRK